MNKLTFIAFFFFFTKYFPIGEGSVRMDVNGVQTGYV